MMFSQLRNDHRHTVELTFDYSSAIFVNPGVQMDETYLNACHMLYAKTLVVYNLTKLG